MAISFDFHCLDILISVTAVALLTSRLSTEVAADTTVYLSSSPTSDAVTPSIYESPSAPSGTSPSLNSSAENTGDSQSRKSPAELTTASLSDRVETSSRSSVGGAPITSSFHSEASLVNDETPKVDRTISSTHPVQDSPTPEQKAATGSGAMQTGVTTSNYQSVTEGKTSPRSDEIQTSQISTKLPELRSSITSSLSPSFIKTRDVSDTYAVSDTPMLGDQPSVAPTLSAGVISSPAELKSSVVDDFQSTASLPRTSFKSFDDPNIALATSFSSDLTTVPALQSTAIPDVTSSTFTSSSLSNTDFSFDQNYFKTSVPSMTKSYLSTVPVEEKSKNLESERGIEVTSTKMYEKLLKSSAFPDIASIEESESPSIEESESPSIEESESPSIEESESPSIEESETPSIEESESPSIEESESPYIEASESPYIESSESPYDEESESPYSEESDSLYDDESESPYIEATETPSIEASETPPIEASETPSIEVSESAYIEASESSYIEASSTVETSTQSHLPFMNDSLFDFSTEKGNLSRRKDKAWSAWMTTSSDYESDSTPESPTYEPKIPIAPFTTLSDINVFDSLNIQRKFILVLKSNCSYFADSNTITSSINKSLKEAGRLKNVQVADTQCSALINISVTLVTVGKLDNLDFALKKAIVSGDLSEQIGPFEILNVIPMDRMSRPSSSVLPPTEAEELLPQEVIAYIVVGVLFGVLLLAAIIVVCAKCVCRRQNSKMELYDLPHVSLNMEDYKLTTIPRPSLVYTDCNREFPSSTGYVDGPYRRNGHITPDGIDQQQTQSDATCHLKTFGRRKPNNDSQGSSDPGTRPSNASSRMSTASVPIVDRWSSNEVLTSNTNLTDITGIENPNYRKWF